MRQNTPTGRIVLHSRQSFSLGDSFISEPHDEGINERLLRSLLLSNYAVTTCCLRCATAMKKSAYVAQP